MEFKKFGNKLKYTLLPSEEYEKIVKVFNFGAAKYGENNWKLCQDKTVFLDACIRHIEKYRQGNKYDEESSIEHLAHAVTNLIMLMHLDS